MTLTIKIGESSENYTKFPSDDAFEPASPNYHTAYLIDFKSFVL